MAKVKNCVTCKSENSKYKCPSCLQPYCSVACYSSHLSSSAPCHEASQRKRQRTSHPLEASSEASSSSAAPSDQITTLAAPTSSSSSSSSSTNTTTAPLPNHPYGLLPSTSIRSNARLHYQVALYAELESLRSSTGRAVPVPGPSDALSKAASAKAVWRSKFGDEDPLGPPPPVVDVVVVPPKSDSASSSPLASTDASAAATAAEPHHPPSHYLPPPDSLTSHLPCTLPTPSMLSLLDESSALRLRLSGPDPTLRLLVSSLLETYDRWIRGRYDVRRGKGRDNPEGRRLDVDERLREIREYGAKSSGQGRGEKQRSERERLLDGLNLVDLILVEIGACTVSENGRVDFVGFGS